MFVTFDTFQFDMFSLKLFLRPNKYDMLLCDFAHVPITDMAKCCNRFILVINPHIDSIHDITIIYGCEGICDCSND